MARICPLFSGSSGNCTYIRDDDGAGILIDAGRSYKSISEALSCAGGDFESIKAIAVTHVHGDHICGLRVLLRRTGLPLYASKETLAALEGEGLLPPGAEVNVIEKNAAVGDMLITRFDTSHDSPGSSGYSVTLKGGSKITVCTDLGVVTDEVRDNLRGSACVLFESNHDIEMLRRGPYPPYLKLRILSDKGHLSNAACAAELAGLLQSGTNRIILGHLSQQNNLPMLARTSAVTALSLAGASENEDYILHVTKPFGNAVVTI